MNGARLLAEVTDSLARLTDLEQAIHARRVRLREVATFLRQGGSHEEAAARIIGAVRRDPLLAHLDALEIGGPHV